MIAKIRTNSGVYNSIVLGFLKKGLKTKKIVKAIVMNENNSALQIVEFWKPKRRVFIIDENTDGWINNNKFEGYDWVYKNISKNFFGIHINSGEIINKCKEMQSRIKDSEWYCIKNIEDIKNLDAAALNFHDAVVESIIKDNDKTTINFSAWDCNIILELTGEIETNLYVGCGNFVTDDGYYDEIFESSMFFEDGYIYWVNSFDIKKSEDIFKYDLNRYFKAQNVRWKIVI